MKNNLSKQNFNRRSFLKLGALVGVLPFVDSLSGRFLLASSPNPKFNTNLVTNGVVISASHWGILSIKVENGKIIESNEYLEGDDFKDLASKELKNNLTTTVADLVYAKNRIKYPMVRKSFLEKKKGNNNLRGKDEWVKIGYQEAIKLSASKLKETRKAFGAEGVFAGSYGWKSSGNLHNSRILLHRFMNMTGGFAGSSGDYSTGAAQIIMPHCLGTIEVYEQQTSWPLILENTDTVVLWGANPVLTSKIAWTSTDGYGLYYFEKLKKSKKKVILIDPRYNETGQYFKAEWIAPNPNTDVAMILGMIHELYTTNNYKKDFISNYTVGFDKFINYVLGKTDKVEKTPKWASKICGIPEKTIKDLALTFYKTKTMIMAGWGIQRAHHGEQPHWAIVTLSCMLGQIGTPGGGFGFSYHYSNGGVPTTNSPVIGGMNIGKSDEAQSGASWLMEASQYTIPVARIADALLNPGKTFDFNGKKLKYPNIDLIYWVGGNPFVHHQDLNKLVKAWAKPSTVIVHDMFWTPTARMADIVFPITTTYERNDITMSGDYSNKHIVPMKQVVAPQFESVSDYQVFLDLSKEFGIDKNFGEGKSEMEWIEGYYNQARDSGVKSGVELPTFEQFWNENKPLSFESNEDTEEFIRYKDFIEDPILNPLGTPSGLIEIYSEVIEKMNYKDCKAHPAWFPPAEWLGMDKKPARFHMISPHPKDRLHSQLSNTKLREGYQIAQREPITINEKDAKSLGVKTGDLVRVFNKRGEILAGVNVSNNVKQGVVSLSEGAWYSPKGGDDAQSKLCLNGCPNVLTIDIPSSELASGNISHTALVNIEKYTKAAPSPYVFDDINMKK